jgi:hypothetical protein
MKLCVRIVVLGVTYAYTAFRSASPMCMQCMVTSITILSTSQVTALFSDCIKCCNPLPVHVIRAFCYAVTAVGSSVWNVVGDLLINNKTYMTTLLSSEHGFETTVRILGWQVLPRLRRAYMGEKSLHMLTCILAVRKTSDTVYCRSITIQINATVCRTHGCQISELKQ